MKKILIAFGLILTPCLTLAQQQNGIQSYLIAIMGFINSTLVPFVFALAFLFFLYNVVRYFVIGASDQGARESARSLALWSITAFVLMVTLWGIVNFLVYGLGFGRTVAPCPDYFPQSECQVGPSEYVEPEIFPQTEEEDPFPADATEVPPPAPFDPNQWQFMLDRS